MSTWDLIRNLMAENLLKFKHVGGQLGTVVTDVNINTVSVVVEEEHYLSIRKLADDLYIPRMSIQHILIKELEMKRVSVT